MKIRTHTKGFTLIELLVVISIIGLLSSIVLASIKDAKDKSGVTKFRAEVNQLINALELYKNATGKYPYEDTTVSGSILNYNRLNDNTESTNAPLPAMLAPYIAGIPKVPNPTTATAGLGIRTNVGSGSMYRCNGDAGIPKYVILVYINNPLIYNGFSNWPFSEYSNDSGATWATTTTSHCFSMK